MQEPFKKDKLKVLCFSDRLTLGQAAASMAIEKIKNLLNEKPVVNLIFAAAPSQNEFLQSIIRDTTVSWKRINAFHMDEYLGLPANAPQSFGAFLRSAIFEKVSFGSVHYLNGNAIDVPAECLSYSTLLNENPVDIVFMGIGENTHLAFNDPFVADFADPEMVKSVRLDLACRQQQVNDACFDRLEDVPEMALTLTIPALLRAPVIYCMVPGETKALAIRHTLSEPVSEQFPSTILRHHENATLFVDEDSFKLSKNLL